jgi:hypothetical protein
MNLTKTNTILDGLDSKRKAKLIADFGQESGVLYTKKQDRCFRCGGTGVFSQFHGVCFRCGGTGRDPQAKCYTFIGEPTEAFVEFVTKREETRRKTAETRAARKAAKRAADLAAWRLEIEADDDLAEVFDYASDFTGASFDIWDRCRAKLTMPTVKQRACLLRSIGWAKDRADRNAERSAVRAASNYVGEVGERITVTATLEKVISYESQWGGGYISIFRDGNGNCLKWGNALSDSNGYSVAEGEEVTLTGTVKKHDIYNGERQTVLLRCKAQ